MIEVFSDGFETGDDSLWGCVPDPEEPYAFVVDDLASGSFLGSFDDCDFTRNLERNLAPSLDRDDFFSLDITSNVLCDFELHVMLSVPTATDYDLELYKWSGSEWSLIASSTQAGSLPEELTCSGCTIVCGGCGCNGCSTDGTYGVRVAREPEALTLCPDYSLAIEER